MDDRLQDDTLAKDDLRNHERLKNLRSAWDSTFQEVDERFPDGAGGFAGRLPGQIRGARNYDSTHITSLERFAAAGVAITTPIESQYIRIKFLDPELMKLRRVKLWCETASARAYALRHAKRSGFGIAANEDWDALGRYGTSLIYTDGRPGRGMFYRALHLAECYIDVDEAGLVDTVHRCFTRTARQIEAEYGADALTPKMRKALADRKEHEEFELLHIVAPNRQWDAERMDFQGKPIASRTLAIGEKLYIRRLGFHSMPIAASRHMTSAGEIYGRSPAIKVMSTIQGANAMRHTTLRAAHKAVDPALIFADDLGVTSLSTRSGGMNPGLISDRGDVLVGRMPGGENGLPFAVDMIEQERAVIKAAFLEEFYKILTDPNSRMTTTEVLEVMGKQGVLVRPFAERYGTEKQDPMSQRELDLWVRNGQIDPFPPEVLEAGAWPSMEYENPLAAMARAESTAKTLRFIEGLIPMANIAPEVFDHLDTDVMIAGMAEEIGVKPSYIRDPKLVAEMRAARGEQQQAAVDAELLAKSAGATLDLAKVRQISEAA